MAESPSRRLLPGLSAPPPREDDVHVVVSGIEVVVEGDEGAPQLPSSSRLAELIDAPVYLGSLEGRSWYGATTKLGAVLPSGMRFAVIRRLFPYFDESTLLAVGYAAAIVEWDTMHRFCGRCAIETHVVSAERARTCPRCKAVFHPRVAPAVIVLIEKDGRILLARGPQFPAGMFGAVAGFVETGESLEEAVIREVREEVGIEIANLRYFGSQPWPFGRSLMIAFSATYAGGEVKLDPAEIAEADWFAIDQLPSLPPRLSIARRLIDAYVGSRREGR